MRDLREIEHKSSVALSDGYKAGAVKVLAVQISDWPRGGSSSDLLVELPEDTLTRAQLFALQAPDRQAAGV